MKESLDELIERAFRELMGDAVIYEVSPVKEISDGE